MTGYEQTPCPVRSETYAPQVGVDAGEVRNDKNDGVSEADEGEEAVVWEPLGKPAAPTAAERAAHEATHLSCRSWCADNSQKSSWTIVFPIEKTRPG